MQIASVIRSALHDYFPEEMDVRIIAEPGRYLVESAFTLAVNIIAKRTVISSAPAFSNHGKIHSHCFTNYKLHRGNKWTKKLYTPNKDRVTNYDKFAARHYIILVHIVRQLQY